MCNEEILVQVLTPVTYRKSLPENDMASGIDEKIGDKLEKFASISREKISQSISDVISMLNQAIVPSEHGPESCEVKVGIGVSAKGGIVIAQLDSEINIEVKVTWKRQSP